MSRRRLQGLGLALAAVVVVLVAAARPTPFDSPRTVRVEVADAAQVAPVGAEVRMAGTTVGRIAGVRRVGDRAELRLELDDTATAPRADATARLRPRLAFEGTAFLDLDPGSPSAPPLGDRTLPLAQTRVSTSLQDVLRLADAPTRRALRATVAGLRATLARRGADGLGAAVDRSGPLLRDVARAAQAARGPSPEALRRAVRGLSRTAGAAASREEDLAPLALGTARAARALRGGGATTASRAAPGAPGAESAASGGAPGSGGAAGAGSTASGGTPGSGGAAGARSAAAAGVAGSGGAALDAALERLPGTTVALAGGARALRRTLRELDPLARDLRPAARSLAPALRETRPLLREATPALRRSTPLLRDARAALRGGAASTPALRRALRALDPALATLDGTLLPALRRRTALGVPAYVSFLNLFGGGGAASRVFDDDGHLMRFGFRFLTGAGAPAPPCAALRGPAPQLATALERAGGCTP